MLRRFYFPEMPAYRPDGQNEKNGEEEKYLHYDKLASVYSKNSLREYCFFLIFVDGKTLNPFYPYTHQVF